MPRPSEETLSKQRAAQINTLVGYIESLVHDRVQIQVEEALARSNGLPMNQELKNELTKRIEEARASIRSTLDLLLP